MNESQNVHFRIQFYDSWKMRNSILSVKRWLAMGKWFSVHSHCPQYCCHFISVWFSWVSFFGMCKLYVHSKPSEGLETMPIAEFFHFWKLYVRLTIEWVIKCVTLVCLYVVVSELEAFMIVFMTPKILLNVNINDLPVSIRDKLWEPLPTCLCALHRLHS